jgi:hypothetical protein
VLPTGAVFRDEVDLGTVTSADGACVTRQDRSNYDTSRRDSAQGDCERELNSRASAPRPSPENNSAHDNEHDRGGKLDPACEMESRVLIADAPGRPQVMDRKKRLGHPGHRSRTGPVEELPRMVLCWPRHVGLRNHPSSIEASRERRHGPIE